MVSDDITVVIATCNRSGALRRTLDSLCVQEMMSVRWRVIVVDNGSVDDTQIMLNSFLESRCLPLDVLYESRRGKACALNLALQYINHGLVVFSDDDVLFERGWLKAYADAIQRWSEYSIFGGKVEPIFPKGTPEWIRDIRVVRQSAMFARYQPQNREGPTDVVPLGPNMAIRRGVIGKHRFDERLGPGGSLQLMGQETEFELRLARLGHGPFIYVPGAKVWHYVRSEQMTVEAVWQRAYRLGRSKMFNRRERRRGPYIRGVPLGDWWGMIRAGVKYLVFFYGPFRLRVKYGRKWREKLGCVRGYLDYYRAQRKRSG